MLKMRRASAKSKRFDCFINSGSIILRNIIIYQAKKAEPARFSLSRLSVYVYRLVIHLRGNNHIAHASAFEALIEVV